MNQLINKKGNGLIKIITGIRRCGKSYLLFNLFKNHLLQCGIDERRIISLSLDDGENGKYLDPLLLSTYLKERITNDSDNFFILLDEAQLAITDEEYKGKKMIKLYGILNSLLRHQNVDVYITGSNSKFLSSDILTEFRGRGDEIRIHLLSFNEFMSTYKGDAYSFDYAIIERLVISSSMATIVGDAFRNTEIGTLEIDENNPNYTCKNGLILTKDETTLVRGFPDKNGKIDVPDTVKTVGDNSLSYSTMLDLNIPSSVTKINGYSVYSNEKLKSINIDANIIVIEPYTFANCKSLTDLKLPNTLRTISQYAFYACYVLKVITIPTSLTSIGGCAFMWCDSLETINFKASEDKASNLTTIGSRAFYDTKKLKSLEIPASVTSIDDEFLKDSGCEYLVLEINKIVFASITLGSNSVKTLKYHGTKVDFKKTIPSKEIFDKNFPKLEKIQLLDESGNFIDVLPSSLTW